MDNQVILTNENSTAPTTQTTDPMRMIADAVSNGASIDVIERLMAMKEKIDAAKAKAAYGEAMAEFKKAVPTIYKKKHVEFGQGDKKTSYNHATIDAVCNAVIPELAKYGLSHSWEPSIVDGAIRVTVIVSHVGGHSETAFMDGPPDTSGAKNPIQARVSTTTYLSRVTLLMRLGLAAQEMDDDGRKSDIEFIAEDQVEQLREGLLKAGGDVVSFCKWLKIRSLEELPVKDLPRAWEGVEAKRAAQDAAAKKKGTTA